MQKVLFQHVMVETLIDLYGKFTVDQTVGKSLNCMVTKFEHSRLSVSETLHFKITISSNLSVVIFSLISSY